jgi:hypothetical protein
MSKLSYEYVEIPANNLGKKIVRKKNDSQAKRVA